MGKKREPVDDVLDAIVWMRRKSKKHEVVDDFIDALLTMRRNTDKQKNKKKKRAKKVAKTRVAKGKSKAVPPAKVKVGTATKRVAGRRAS